MMILNEVFEIEMNHRYRLIILIKLVSISMTKYDLVNKIIIILVQGWILNDFYIIFKGM